MAVVLTLGAVQIVEFTYRQDAARSQLLQALEGNDPCFGAAAMADPSCPPTTKGPVLPAPAQAAVDKSEAYADDCWESSPFAGTRECVFGDPNGSVSIALVGNSHAGQWLGPIDAIARSKGWKVTTFLASMCTATSIDLQWTSAEGRDGCRQWGRNVLEATTTGEFDLVLTAERNSFAAAGKSLSESEPVWEKGYSDYLRSWLASDVNVAVIQDSPLPAKDIQSIPDCVAEHMDDLEQCAGDAGTWIPDDPLVRAATKLQDERVSVIDLNASFCTTTCPAVIGGVVVYFDGSHITNTYAMTLAPYLVGPLGAAVQGATAN